MAARISPPGDLRFQRPYFLVPMDPDDQALRRRAIDRIGAWVASRGAVTDLFILSHGWHRNFYAAVSAYDRVMARLAFLLHSSRLTPPPGFNPVFIALHWHSDPGADGWVDECGRRHKASFMANVELAFERSTNPKLRFTKDFECLFELMSAISAPGVDALGTADGQRRARRLTFRLYRYALKEMPDASPAEKVVTLWKCYHEAQPKGVLLDQDEQGKRFVGFLAAWKALLTMLITVAGIGAVIGAVSWIWKQPRIREWLTGKGSELLAAARGVPFLRWFLDGAWAGPKIALLLLVLSLLAVLTAVAYRAGIGWWKRLRSGPARVQGRVEEPTTGLSFLSFAAWLYLQVVLSLPLLAYCLFTYAFSWTMLPRLGLFQERFGRRNQPPVRRRFPSLRILLEYLARFPVWLVKQAMPRDSSYAPTIAAVDNQLAFWEMQSRAVDTGDRAGRVVAEIAAFPNLCGARLHFLGHSFGALVVANLLRRLAFPEGFAFPGQVHSVCLLQAAMARDWFDGEFQVIDRLAAALSCTYSRYDTANGFYYPLANQGRLATGYLGFYAGKGLRTGTGVKIPLEPKGRYASLVRPPDLGAFPGPPPRVLNVDASRLIYEGAVVLGGGHDDIFKDDVTHLVWALAAI